MCECQRRFFSSSSFKHKVTRLRPEKAKCVYHVFPFFLPEDLSLECDERSLSCLTVQACVDLSQPSFGREIDWLKFRALRWWRHQITISLPERPSCWHQRPSPNPLFYQHVIVQCAPSACFVEFTPLCSIIMI